jgi:hypothetical protein
MRKKRKCVIVLKSFLTLWKKTLLLWLLASDALSQYLTTLYCIRPWINHVSTLCFFFTPVLVQLISSGIPRRKSLRWDWSKTHLPVWCSHNCLLDRFPSYRLFPSSSDWRVRHFAHLMPPQDRDTDTPGQCTKSLSQLNEAATSYRHDSRTSLHTR